MTSIHRQLLELACGLIIFALFLIIGLKNIVLSLLFGGTIFLPGVLLLYVARQGRAAAPLAIPGMIIAGTGGILMFQSLTNYWESWAYAWTLYAVFFGYGMILMGQRLENPQQVKLGQLFTMIGGVSFIILGALFIMATTPILRYLIAFAAFSMGITLLTQLYTNKTPQAKAKRSHSSVEYNVEQMRINIEENKVA